MQRIFTRLFMAMVLIASGFGVIATPAQAAECSGNMTYRLTAPDKSAELQIFYSSANGGTNTACLKHLGSFAGTAAFTSVVIGRCTTYSGPEGTPCRTDKWSSMDSGDYKYYAGPRSVSGTAARCVIALGRIWLRNGNLWLPNSGRQGCRD